MATESSPQQRKEGREKMSEIISPECLSEEANSAEEPGGKDAEKYTRKQRDSYENFSNCGNTGEDCLLGFEP